MDPMEANALQVRGLVSVLAVTNSGLEISAASLVRRTTIVNMFRLLLLKRRNQSRIINREPAEWFIVPRRVRNQPDPRGDFPLIY